MTTKPVPETLKALFGASLLIERIKSALGTAEDGEALVEVARNAHRAEIELAARIRAEEDDGFLANEECA